MIEATMSMTNAWPFTMTERDLRKGVAHAAYDCPLALALVRAGFALPMVGVDENQETRAYAYRVGPAIDSPYAEPYAMGNGVRLSLTGQGVSSFVRRFDRAGRFGDIEPVSGFVTIIGDE